MYESSEIRFRHFFPLLPIYLFVVITAGAPSPVSLGSPVLGSSAGEPCLPRKYVSVRISYEPNSLMNFGLKLGVPSAGAVGQGTSRKRKSVGSLSRIYEGLMKGPKERGIRSQTSKLTQQQQQSYPGRSASRSREYRTYPSTTSAEYFVSEFRRLFATQPTPRRPYAMRLRWG